MLVLLLSGCSLLGSQPSPPSLGNAHVDGELDNGMRYHLQEASGERLELRLSLSVGLAHDPEGLEGISHYVEHMAFNGTERFPGNSVIDVLQAEGISFGGHANAQTTDLRTTYMLSVPPERVDLALEVLAQQAMAVTFDPAEVEAERGILAAEDRQRGLPPDLQAGLARIGPADLVAFYEAHYRPSAADLVVAGVLPPDVHDRIARAFDAWPVHHTEKPPPRRDITRERSRVRSDGMVFGESASWRWDAKTEEPTYRERAAVLVATSHLARVSSQRGVLVAAEDDGVHLLGRGPEALDDVLAVLGGTRVDGWDRSRDLLTEGWSDRPAQLPPDAVEAATWIMEHLDDEPHDVDRAEDDRMLGAALADVQEHEVQQVLERIRAEGYLWARLDEPTPDDPDAWLRARLEGLPALAVEEMAVAPVSTPAGASVAPLAQQGPLSLWSLHDGAVHVLHHERPDASTRRVLALLPTGHEELDGAEERSRSSGSLAQLLLSDPNLMDRVKDDDAFVALVAAGASYHEAMGELVGLFGRHELLRHSPGTVWVFEGPDDALAASTVLGDLAVVPLDPPLGEGCRLQPKAGVVEADLVVWLELTMALPPGGGVVAAQELLHHVLKEVRERLSLVYAPEVEVSSWNCGGPWVNIKFTFRPGPGDESRLADALVSIAATLRSDGLDAARGKQALDGVASSLLLRPGTEQWLDVALHHLAHGRTPQDVLESRPYPNVPLGVVDAQLRNLPETSRMKL